MDSMTRVEGNGLTRAAREQYFAWQQSIQRSKPGMDPKTQSRIDKLRQWEARDEWHQNRCNPLCSHRFLQFFASLVHEWIVFGPMFPDSQLIAASGG